MRWTDFDRHRQSPLADPGCGTGFTGHGTMVMSNSVRQDWRSFSCREVVLEPVTNQVTTSPVHCGHSATYPDTQILLNCSNQT